MSISFHKMHGLGNDFVILDAREKAVELEREQRARLADRHLGVGCDQLIRLAPSESADVRMDIWNADGGAAEACGNATRCVAALTGATTIETDGGILDASVDGKAISVTLPPPRFDWNAVPLAEAMDTRPLPLAWEGVEHPDALSVGNPHVVFFVDDADAIGLETLGKSVQADPLFPEGVNVNVASVAGDTLKLRTFERGAGATLACGTGACASAVAAVARKLLPSPVRVEMPGGSLTIAWQPGGSIVMTGGATHVFSGTLENGALA